MDCPGPGTSFVEIGAVPTAGEQSGDHETIVATIATGDNGVSPVFIALLTRIDVPRAEFNDGALQ